MGFGTALLSAGWIQPVRAQVYQVDAAQTPLPQPVPEPEWNLVTQSWAYARDTRVNRDAEGNDIFDEGLTFGDFYPDFEDGDAITLEGLFKWRGETIDPSADASVGPGYFEPSCAFRAEVVLRGTSSDCYLGLGWYNIEDVESSEPPAPTDIYELVPRYYDMDCTVGLCPLAWDNVNPRDLSEVAWNPVVFTAEDLTEDSRYAGGYIGFVLVGDPETSCSVNKHSLPGHNPKNASGEPWLTALSYASSLDQNAFYLAFEELPMSEEDWTETGINGNEGRSDGDFNDTVVYVSGDGCELCLGDCDDRDPPPGAGGAGAGGTSSGAAGAAGEATVTDTTSSSGATQAGTTTSSTVSTSGTPGGTGGTGGGSGGDGEAAAGGTSSAECVPGRQLECTCVDGAKGAQVCNEDGDGYSACECNGAPASAGSDDGGCGCRVTSAASDPNARFGMLLAALAAVARRRRLLSACERKREFEGGAAG